MEDNWRGNIFCHCHGIRLGNRIFSVAGVATTLAARYIATTLQFDSNLPMSQYPQINVRVDEEFLARLDEWRRNQPDLPTRPEALRRLAEQALAMAPKRGRVKEK